MAKRLTSHIRDQIAKSVLTHRFSDEINALIAERSAFAEDVYNDVYRKADREKMAALPAGWLPEADSLTAQFGEGVMSYAAIPFNGDIYNGFRTYRKGSKPVESVRRRSFNKHCRGCWKVYPADHRLSLRYEKIESAERDLARRIRETEQQVVAALASTSSVSVLLKAWPEIEPFAKHFITTPVKLPAIPVETLNETLGLPVAEAA